MKAKLYFLICLTLCACTVGYLYLFTEDRYTSISQFSIIVDDQNSVDVSSGLLSMISGKGVSASPDMQSAIGFVQSADLLLKLENEFDLLNHFKKKGSNDFVFILEDDASMEDRLSYYRTKIVAEYNQATGLIDLSVETFEPKLSLEISNRILENTERFINSLNKDVAHQRLEFVRDELTRGQERVNKCEHELLAFQSKHKILEPQAIIASRLEAIQSLRMEKMNKQIELSIVKATSYESPSIPALQSTILKLSEEIQTQEAKLAGPDHLKLNQILAEYKTLQLNLTFAITLKEGAALLLEQTRAEAMSNTRFFSIIQKAYLSEEHTNPRRAYLSLTLVAGILLTFYICRALLMSIFDRG